MLASGLQDCQLNVYKPNPRQYIASISQVRGTFLNAVYPVLMFWSPPGRLLLGFEKPCFRNLLLILDRNS